MERSSLLLWLPKVMLAQEGGLERGEKMTFHLLLQSSWISSTHSRLASQRNLPLHLSRLSM